MTDEPRLSADFARTHREPLYGTATFANVWFLLEYNGIYTADVWADARIPQAVIDKLLNYPNGRALLIRQPEQASRIDGLITFFIVQSTATKSRIYRFTLESYQDVMEIDVEAVLRGKVVAPQQSPLYVVCTNGKRDICCAKYGLALYRAMIPQVYTQVWQSSHIGGHRFAGTMYCFPEALCYGYLDPDDGEALIDAYHKRRILLNKVRGRAIYKNAIQAAEYFVRREFDNDDMDDVIYQSHRDHDHETVSVLFLVKGTRCEMTIGAAPSIQVLATSGSDQYKTIPQYGYVHHQIFRD